MHYSMDFFVCKEEMNGRAEKGKQGFKREIKERQNKKGA